MSEFVRIRHVRGTQSPAIKGLGGTDKRLLEAARPFLIQAYRNAIRYSSLLAERQRSQAGGAILQLDRLVALGLTERQAEVLRAVATGAAEREIAERLSISHRTGQKHLERCYRRLGVNSRSLAAGIAWTTLDREGSETATGLR